MRNNPWSYAVVAAFTSLMLAGCPSNVPENSPKGGSPEKSASAPRQRTEAEIEAALAKLSPEDRELAEAQKWCAVRNKNRLGSMDTPHRVMVDGHPVFVCCAGCEDRALEDPAKTLAKVEELKKAAASAK
jgi:hypothetical protein